MSGVKVGTVDSITPEGTQIKDDPQSGSRRADSGRRQGCDRRAEPGRRPIRPAHTGLSQGGGPTMRDGAVIAGDRTAVPVEWDEVKTQLMRLATELGPKTGVSGTSVSRFVDSAASGGVGTATARSYGRRWRLSGVARIFAEAAGTSSTSSRTCRSSSQRFATARSRSSCSRTGWRADQCRERQQVRPRRGAADLSVAVGEIQRFVAGVATKLPSRSAVSRA